VKGVAAAAQHCESHNSHKFPSAELTKPHQLNQEDKEKTHGNYKT
jgi:hypothetical protein